MKEECLLSALLIVGLMMIPTIVWLVIGLPLEVEVSWEFGFFYSIYFVGAFGLASSWFLVAFYFERKVLLKAYVVTNRHVMIFTANLTRGLLHKADTGVLSLGYHSVGPVERIGNTVKFSTIQWLNSASTTKLVLFCKLATADAAAVFALLQQLHPEHPVPVGAEEPREPTEADHVLVNT